MTIKIDVNQTIVSLRNGDANPEQQREAACLLILMRQLDDWVYAERVYCALRASHIIEPKEE